MAEAAAMRTLNSLGWDWRDNGVIFHFVADGQPGAWFIPLAHVRMVFGQEMAAVGCPLQPHVGDPPTVSGFFSSIARAVKSVGRGVSRAARGVARGAKRAVRAGGRLARKAYKKVVPKAIRRAARRVQRTAMKAYKGVSSLARKGLNLAGNVPLLGNVAKLGTSALDITDRVARGKMPSLKQLSRAARNAGLAAADYVVPGSGTLARAGLGAGLAALEGKRLDRALLEGGVQAASNYVPEQVARGALAAGRRIARGERIDRALTSGALTTARGYVPKGYGRDVFDVARGAAAGKRVDRLLKRKLLKKVKSKHLRGVIPDTAAFNAAGRALQAARSADRNTLRGLRRIASRARRGDARSLMFAKALRQLAR